jgi:hypothetical protein
MAFFENYETMWHQVHEMLYIEQGVNMDRPLEPDAIADQLKDELAAYNPLIPNGAELVATIMIEVENPARRDALLDSLGGIEDCFVITLDKHEIRGIREEDTDRTNAAGRASSVQFVHFPFKADEITLFTNPKTTVTIACTHANYGHMAKLSDAVRIELSGDFES